MVDPLSLEAITTAVTAAAGSVGTEAGRQAWGSLADLARRAFGRGDRDAADDAAAPAVPLPLEPDSERQNQALAALLYGRAFQDEVFAAEYRRWEEQSRAVTVSTDHSTVVNNVSGNARVRNLYQGRDITVNPR
ncbi:hypothetical protein [Streptomyces sp. NPDC053048]|uniref:hypothetical protein n=1 Tax=Streptomyces sp. NPDC053048 TaxID=3365694 RepID=UPI0037D63108